MMIMDEQIKEQVRYRYRISQLKTHIDVNMDEIPSIIARKLGINSSDILNWEIKRQSIDSRKKPKIYYVYTVDFNLKNKKYKNIAKIKKMTTDISGESDYDSSNDEIFSNRKEFKHRPIIVGFGPCGIFAALEFAEKGYNPIVVERGPEMSARIKAVSEFEKRGFLNPEANLLFGEGGAGTFSDGKIGTGIKSGLIRKVLKAFCDAGAGEDVMYLAKPHIGTDVLRRVIVELRKKIESLGGEIWFDTRLSALDIKNGKLCGVELKGYHSGYQKTENLILAIGHSARDTFELIYNAGLDIQSKPFSIGVRMEHPQEIIDKAQYGVENLNKLPPADYKLSYKASNGRGVYSFCMCPGGYVVVCTTSDGELCVNGMSNRQRNSGYANSGILCDVRKDDFADGSPLAGVKFQQKYERLAFENGGGNFIPPKCSMSEFLNGKSESAVKVINSLPEFAYKAISEAVPHFAKIIDGYDMDDAVVKAVETRSSSPVRIVRNDRCQSNISGIYPAGEGAGYAGGIMSAACDGIKVARKIMSDYQNK